jgi:hypothetical protein
MINRENKNAQRLFLLLGEKVRMRADEKHKIKFPHFLPPSSPFKNISFQ